VDTDGKIWCRMRSDQWLRVLWPAHGPAYLGGNDDRHGHSRADQLLPDVEPGGLHHGVEYAQDDGQDQQDERHGGGDLRSSHRPACEPPERRRTNSTSAVTELSGLAG
jgi:hypothetical protein